MRRWIIKVIHIDLEYPPRSFTSLYQSDNVSTFTCNNNVTKSFVVENVDITAGEGHFIVHKFSSITLVEGSHTLITDIL